jgi:hypothetical protein
LDTFIDHDRGYFPRVGLYDRRLNPRKGSHVIRNLCSAVNTYGPEIKILDHRVEDEWKIIEFQSKYTKYWLYLPQSKNAQLELSDSKFDSIIIDLITSTINPNTYITNRPYLKVCTRTQ